jgi:CxxC-x17-CxxC domain-containing protein
MKDFNKGGFKKSFGGDRGGDRGFGSKPSFGGNRGGFNDRPSFNKKPWDKGNRDSGDKQMFSATCASCGKQCEVPFKPVDGRPVYCTDCFRTDRDEGGNRGSSERSFSAPAPRRDFNDRNDRNDRPSFAPKQAADNRIDGVAKQLEKVSSQLEQLISMMKNNAPKQSANVQVSEKPVAKTEAPKAPVAKAEISKPVGKAEAKKMAPAKKAVAKKKGAKK